MSTPRSRPVDGFSLAYDLRGRGRGRATVVGLHGWPGDRTDYRILWPLLEADARLVLPDLRGFGESDKHVADPSLQYDASAQARSVVGLLDELDVESAVLVGYDIGSRVAQAVALARPDLVDGLVLSPPLPGAGRRTLSPRAQAQFWYQHLHRLDLARQLLDGRPEQIRVYLEHFWSRWSGPGLDLQPTDLDRLVARYCEPGAFVASTQWYRARPMDDTPPVPEHRYPTRTTVLWPELDPLFPREWSDRLSTYFDDATLQLVDGVGHFAPLEYPAVIADAVRSHLGGRSSR